MKIRFTILALFLMMPVASHAVLPPCPNDDDIATADLLDEVEDTEDDLAVLSGVSPAYRLQLNTMLLNTRLLLDIRENTIPQRCL